MIMESEKIILNGQEMLIITKLDDDLKEDSLMLEDTIDLTEVLEQTKDLSNEIINNDGANDYESKN